MEKIGFLATLDRFLAGLTGPGLGSFATELYRNDVMSEEELTELDPEKEEPEEVRRKLIFVVRRINDKSRLKAVAHALSAFKQLHQRTRETIKERRSELASPTAEQGTKKAVPTAESKILKIFEEGTMLQYEIELALEEASRTSSLSTIANFEGKTLLHLACCLMPVEIAKLLVEAYSLSIAARDKDENTPLHEACRCNKTQIVKYLMSLSHCDLNAQNSDGNTPLHVAIMNGHWSIGRIMAANSRLVVPIDNAAGETPLTLLDLQIPSADTKRMKKMLAGHSSCRKLKTQEESVKKSSPPKPPSVKKKTQFAEEVVTIPIPSSTADKSKDTKSTMNTSTSSAELCKSLFIGNPPVIVVLVILVLGILIGGIIIAVAGYLFFGDHKE